MRSREIDCLVMSIFSYMSIVLISISFYFDGIRPKGITASTESRFFSYLMIEFGYLISIWKYFKQVNLGNIIKLYYLQAFLANNIVMKHARGKKLIFFDLLLLFLRVWHLINTSKRTNMSEICSHCERYSIEMNIAEKLKMKILLRVKFGLYNMFGVVTMVYAWKRNLNDHFIVTLILFGLIYILEHHDHDEKMSFRILTILLHSLSFYSNFRLIQVQYELKE